MVYVDVSYSREERGVGAISGSLIRVRGRRLFFPPSSMLRLGSCCLSSSMRMNTGRVLVKCGRGRRTLSYVSLLRGGVVRVPLRADNPGTVAHLAKVFTCRGSSV